MKLTPITESDYPTLQKWLDDPAIFYYMKSEPHNPDLGRVNFGIHSNGNLIGWASLINIDPDNEKAEFGIAVPGHQTKVCYQATIETLRFGFQRMGLNRIYIRPLRSNLRENDQRERFGFKREGIERQSVKRGDTFEDVIVLSMLKEEFEKRFKRKDG